ncbi:MAG TPA: hypothetical protein VEK07_00955 [Polyangiaceae bacterium]|nr:hypothetical protein [Polyangiaceae bacterium]
MKPRLVIARIALLLPLSSCGPVYEDSGSPDPASWWPWVCEDGGLAPETGCPPPPGCADDAGLDGEADGGC